MAGVVPRRVLAVVVGLLVRAEGAKRGFCGWGWGWWRRREVLAVDVGGFCWWARAAARRLGGAMVGWRRGAVVKGSGAVVVERVGGIFWSECGGGSRWEVVLFMRGAG